MCVRERGGRYGVGRRVEGVRRREGAEQEARRREGGSGAADAAGRGAVRKLGQPSPPTHRAPIAVPLTSIMGVPSIGTRALIGTDSGCSGIVDSSRRSLRKSKGVR